MSVTLVILPGEIKPKTCGIENRDVHHCIGYLVNFLIMDLWAYLRTRSIYLGYLVIFSATKAI